MAFWFYLLALLADFLSSLPSHPGFVEQNPFARHADGSFWPLHAALNSLAWTLARWGAALVWLEGAWEHWQAAWDNLQILAGLWVDLA